MEKCSFPTLLPFSQASTAGCSRVISKNGYSCNLTEEEGGERVRSLAVRKPHVVCDYLSWFKACKQHRCYRTSTFSFLWVHPNLKIKINSCPCSWAKDFLKITQQNSVMLKMVAPGNHPQPQILEQGAARQNFKNLGSNENLNINDNEYARVTKVQR